MSPFAVFLYFVAVGFGILFLAAVFLVIWLIRLYFKGRVK